MQVSSISEWIQGLKQGDAAAAQQLWDRFSRQLLEIARARTRSLQRPLIDADDIVASAFESLWRGATAGRLDNVKNRDELWWLLLAITRRKAVSHIRREKAQKRGGGAIITRSLDRFSFQDLVSEQPNVEYVVALQEEYTRLLKMLRDDTLRQIAVLKVEGFNAQEIAQRLKISTATVGRKLRLIRDTWRKDFGQ